jgi:hypothetical protein
MTDQELASVTNFKVIRDGFGEIQWEGRTDVRGLNLDELVFIEKKVTTCITLTSSGTHDLHLAA